MLFAGYDLTTVIHFSFPQLLAALLITRQVVGNIKESIIPYAKKHFKLAQLSFDKYGALSPSDNKPKDQIAESNGSLNKECAIENKKCESGENSPENNSVSPRKFSQVECESSAPKVLFKTIFACKNQYHLIYV